MCRLFRREATNDVVKEHCEEILQLKLQVSTLTDANRILKREMSDMESDIDLATSSTTSAFLKGFEAGRDDDLGTLARVIGRQTIVEGL